MSFDKIISIPGKPGLFKMVAQMRNGGFVVEAMADGKRVPVSSMERIIMLKDISVYTMDEDMPLDEVFRKMKANDAIASSISSKAEPADLKLTLKKILPEFNEDRVHVSDIRKMFSWYSLLKENVSFEKQEPEVEVVEVIDEELPKKKAKAKSTESVDVNATLAEETPVKKVVRKKKTDDDSSVAAEGKTKVAAKTARKSTKSEE